MWVSHFGPLVVLLCQSIPAHGFWVAPRLPEVIRLYESSTGTTEAQLALLLPSSPEDPMLQESAEQIVAQLSSSSSPCRTGSVVTCNTAQADAACQDAAIVVALGIQFPLDVRFVATAFRLRRTAGTKGTCQFALGGKPFAPLLDQYDEANPTWQRNVPFTAEARDRTLMLEMQTLFEKGEIDDYVQAIQLYFSAKQG